MYISKDTALSLRAQIESEYEINDHDCIESAGTFFQRPIWAPFFWSLVCAGSADEIFSDGHTTYCVFRPDQDVCEVFDIAEDATILVSSDPEYGPHIRTIEESELEALEEDSATAERENHRQACHGHCEQCIDEAIEAECRGEADPYYEAINARLDARIAAQKASA